MSPQQSPRSRPQGRKPARPAEFPQNKPLTVRSEYHYDRTIFTRSPRDYFSPFAVRQ